MMLGLTACTTSWPSPSRSIAPGAKFSTMTSARFAMFLTRSSPRSDLRLTVMDFLLALNNRKYQESWFGLWLGPDCRPNKERPASPPCGFSTLTTSAPSQASASVLDGPASNWVRSRTRTPARNAGNAPFVVIFSSSPQWHRLRQIWMSWTLVGAPGIRGNQANCRFKMTVAGGGDAPGGMRRDADEIERGISEFARGSHGDRGLIVTADGLAIIHRQLIVALGTAHASSDLPFAPLCPRWGADHLRSRYDRPLSARRSLHTAWAVEVDIPIRKDSNKQKVSRSLSFKSAPSVCQLDCGAAYAVPAALRRAGGAKD